MSRGNIKLELFDEQIGTPEFEIDLERHANLKFSKTVDADNPADIYNYLTSTDNMRITSDINALVENFLTFHQIMGMANPTNTDDEAKYLVRVENWRKYRYFYPTVIAIVESKMNGKTYVPPYGYEFYEDEDPYSDTDSSYSPSEDDANDDDFFGGFEENDNNLSSSSSNADDNDFGAPSDDENLNDDEEDLVNHMQRRNTMTQITAPVQRSTMPVPFTSLPKTMFNPRFTSKNLEKFINYKALPEKKILVSIDPEAMKKEREQEPDFASLKQFVLKDGLSRRDIDHFFKDEKNKILKTTITVFEPINKLQVA